jgi:hypothetical protein
MSRFAQAAAPSPKTIRKQLMVKWKLASLRLLLSASSPRRRSAVRRRRRAQQQERGGGRRAPSAAYRQTGARVINHRWTNRHGASGDVAISRHSVRRRQSGDALLAPQPVVSWIGVRDVLAARIAAHDFPERL